MSRTQFRPIAFPTLTTPAGPRRASAPFWNPQRTSSMPFGRYRPAHERVEIPLVDRTWPDARIEQAPLWVPVDLRDGNQALVEPMDPERKLCAFSLQIAMGFKEIEVGYPSASGLDYDFVRLLATHDIVPDDVTIVVVTPARFDLISRTFDTIRGLDRAVVHMYSPQRARGVRWRPLRLRLRLIAEPLRMWRCGPMVGRPGASA